MTKYDTAEWASLQTETPTPTKSADPGSAQGSDEIHLTQSVRCQQQCRPSYYKQMELRRNRNLQTICMTRVFFYYHGIKHSHHYTGEASHHFLRVYGWLGPFLPEAKIFLLRAVVKDLFLATSVLLLRLYLPIAASPKINNTNTTKLILKTCIGPCTPMFIAALFTIAKIWKRPKWPSTDG